MLLLVDDDAAIGRWERRVLASQQYDCTTASDVPEARTMLGITEFQLVLLDVNLPGGSGIELLAEIRREQPEIAILIVTGEDDLELAMIAIELGAFGYLVKPVGAGELLIHVANALHRRRQEADLLRRIERLETDRGAAEHKLAGVLNPDGGDIAAVLENDQIQRLVRLAEFRDAQTGQHLVRMSRYCELIARILGLQDALCERIRLASELHDVGKVAIPDRVLLKPGQLNENERAVMETHAEIGHRLLSDSESELMGLAATIALTHHERWDGAGYPRRIGGDAIAPAGRIAAVADVFDALTSDRVYRPAMPVGMAVDMMRSGRGNQFDPEALDAMLESLPSVESIRREYAD